MELLAGTRDVTERTRLRARLIALPRLTARGLVDFEAAAELYRLCRVRGASARKLIDCLIAAVVSAAGAPVLDNRGGS